MVPGMRYRQKEWPEWMTAHHFMTVDGQEWLNVDNKEMPVPEYDWIVRRADGVIGVESWRVMEKANKVIPDPPKVVHPEAEVDEEALLGLASKLTGKSVEELRAEQEAGRAELSNVVQIKPTQDVGGIRDVFLCLQANDLEGARNILRTLLASETQWCNCVPGQCDGIQDKWSCRKNSPLAM